MIRLFVLIGIVGGGAITYLATYGVGPEAQLPPAVSQIEKFRAAGLIPDANAVTENEELEHDIFEVPPEDEVRLEMAMEQAGDMPGMEMGAAEGDKMEMGAGEGAKKEMAGTEGAKMEMAGAEEKEHGEEEMQEGEMPIDAGGLRITAEGEFDREIDLAMTEWGFSQMKIDVKVGDRIKFTVKNGGKIPHEFMFMTMPAMAAITYRATRADWSLLEHEALLEESLVLPGGDFGFVVEVKMPGTWMFMCMLPYHMQMGMMGQMATPGMAMDMQM